MNYFENLSNRLSSSNRLEVLYVLTLMNGVVRFFWGELGGMYNCPKYL